MADRLSTVNMSAVVVDDVDFAMWDAHWRRCASDSGDVVLVSQKTIDFN